MIKKKMMSCSRFKRIVSFTLIAFLTLVLSINSYSQITIGQDDMPSVGDTIRISTGINIDLYNFEETGEDYIWDYSSLYSLSQRVDTFVSVTQTPLLYWPFFLLSANLASPIFEASPIPGIPLSEVYNFYNNSSSNYKDVGFAANLFGLPLSFKFNTPDIVYDFPMNYGNADSSRSGFSFGLDDFGFILVDRMRVNTVDGWGTLITPYGTFDVLRVKSKVTEYDSIYIDSLSVGVPINREYIEYKWLGAGQKLPLLKVTDDLLGFVVEYIDTVSPVTSIQADSRIQKHEINIYPNPTSSIINIDINERTVNDVLFSIYGIDGQLFCTGQLKAVEEGPHRIKLSDHLSMAGQYIIQLKIDNKQYIRKFMFLSN